MTETMKTFNSPTPSREWFRGAIVLMDGIAIGVMFALCCLIGGYALVQMLGQVS